MCGMCNVCVLVCLGICVWVCVYDEWLCVDVCVFGLFVSFLTGLSMASPKSAHGIRAGRSVGSSFFIPLLG